MNITPRHDNILVSEIEGGMMTVNGIILPDDDMRERGIKPRWCKVHAVGPKVHDIKPNEWILVDHGRWSRGFEHTLNGVSSTFRWVDYKDVLGVHEDDPKVKTR